MWEPFGTAPANATASWRSSPNERGTLNILSSCVITLLLCAYTSLHLDIPAHGKAGWRHQTWRRALWVLAGLLAPEVVAFIAFHDWSRARTLDFRINTLLGDTNTVISASGEPGDVERDLSYQETEQVETLPPRQRYPWTRIHSHFALMGGFAALDHQQDRITLTPVALRTMARTFPSLLPDISAEFIRDKSKANSFAKLLVCIQACWFIAQTIGRLATRLPISLLEMNTLLHALCCLLIYLAWWHKPLDIDEPYVIDTSDQFMKKVLAWMAVKDAQPIHHDAYMDDAGGCPEKTILPKIQLIYEDDMSHGDDIAETARKALVDSKEHNRAQTRMEELLEPEFGHQWVPECRAEQGLVRLYPGQRIHGFVAICQTLGKTDQLYARLPLEHIGLLKLAHSFRHDTRTGQEWDFGNQFEYSRSEDKMLIKEMSPGNTADRELDNWRHSTFASPEEVFASSMYFVGSLYGGCHLFAWYGPFPTMAQRILWRISCCIIVSPILLALSVFLAKIVLENLIMPHKKLFRWLPSRVRRRELWSPLPDLAILGIMVFLFIHTAARLYLVVECFINIAYLPEDVFKEPRWSRYIPHFGAG
ncbi:hypothetical protein FB567DRAFT_511241 [Paraphoma chrysanthemicola]|uniref:Uncharacterized protein n=1 Tax=Paraphoma chrysanthemicola TaxID=798071 RepID=A0A8K0RJE4_9PLEO|nr:hypothetical protein FB567DRAFT_511241 [Paraphoma chrysanthemicola]